MHTLPQVLHHGAKDGVTGSCHQLIIDAKNSLLIDCGLFQGAETSTEGQASQEQLTIEFDISTVKALLVTHVHIDHVGRIPYLLAAGFNGPIICSEPSAKLLPIVLEDAFKLGVSRDQHLVEKYIKLIASRIIALPYNRWLPMLKAPKVSIRLQRAGHILGSAYIELDIPGATPNNTQRVLFSGDLGAPYAPILSAPKPAYRADLVILESTYGDRQHANRRDRRKHLQSIIEHALRDQGTVLIPAFSIGRTQELLYELEDIIHRNHSQTSLSNSTQLFNEVRQPEHSNLWQDIPIILDSPLASRFTQAYKALHRFWDQEAQQRVQKGRNPLDFQQLLTVDEHHDHQRMVQHLANSKRPAIVIAGGGMCSGGRIVNYLEAMLDEPRHNVLFVGYQAQGTLGSRIQKYGPQGGYVDINQRRIEIHAEISTLGGYSAHADQSSLLRFITGMRKWPTQVRLIHGDAQAKAALQGKIKRAFTEKQHHGEVIIPS
ncbi:MAG: MBL fold metallo-hydrolase [Pseudomonas sp.]|nr:MBL fold metallo-hydrolase [Pseudomonas sp.]